MGIRPFALVALGILLFACQSGAPIGTGCTRTSECASPLVCRIERCRTECVAARDCPAGQVCLINEDGLGACELPALDVCSLSCDPPLVCAAGHCRVECTSDGDCPGGHVCASGACQRADLAMDAGVSDAGTDAAPQIQDAASADHGDTGLVCDPVAETGCGAGERCSVGSGSPSCIADTGTLVLGDACTSDVECGAGLSCQGSRCVRVCFIGDTTFCGTDLTCSIDSVHGQVFLDSANGIGLCTEPCDPLDPSSCLAPGATCAIGVGAAGAFTWCRDVGTRGENDPCVHAFDCGVALDCYMGSCRAFCLASDGTGCPGGRHCVGSANFVTRPDVGACIP